MEAPLELLAWVKANKEFAAVLVAVAALVATSASSIAAWRSSISASKANAFKIYHDTQAMLSDRLKKVADCFDASNRIKDRDKLRLEFSEFLNAIENTCLYLRIKAIAKPYSEMLDQQISEYIIKFSASQEYRDLCVSLKTASSTFDEIDSFIWRSKSLFPADDWRVVAKSPLLKQPAC